MSAHTSFASANTLGAVGGEHGWQRRRRQAAHLYSRDLRDTWQMKAPSNSVSRRLKLIKRLPVRGEMAPVAVKMKGFMRTCLILCVRAQRAAVQAASAREHSISVCVCGELHRMLACKACSTHSLT